MSSSPDARGRFEAKYRVVPPAVTNGFFSTYAFELTPAAATVTFGTIRTLSLTPCTTTSKHALKQNVSAMSHRWHWPTSAARAPWYRRPRLGLLLPPPTVPRARAAAAAVLRSPRRQPGMSQGQSVSSTHGQPRRRGYAPPIDPSRPVTAGHAGPGAPTFAASAASAASASSSCLHAKRKATLLPVTVRVSSADPSQR
jgi:hypothetical protein